ncbi:MAG: acyl-CoA dehydrogenase family protein [Myxococcota bacterium]
MADWLLALCTPPPTAVVAELEPMLARWQSMPGSAFERAVAAGMLADRVGLAFAAGYRSALLALTGETGHAALCITEKGGAHPRAIETRLEWQGDTAVLTGTKAWSTLADHARTLLVAASTGTKNGRNQLRMVRVPVDAEGLQLRAMPPTAFTPEIPHFRVELSRVRVDAEALLEGDGYDRWIKPFRTVEDIHVTAAALAHLVTTGRRAGWSAKVLAEGVALVAALADLARRPPLDPAVHLALGGVLTSFEAWVRRVDHGWSGTTPEVRARWIRDQPLLGVASKARSARFARAVATAGLRLG